MGTIGLGCRLGWKWVLRRPNSGKPLQWCWHEGGIWLWSRDQANCLSTSGPLDINHILDDIGSKSAFQYTMFIVQGHVKRFKIQFLRKYFKRDVHWSVIFPSPIRQPFYSDRVAQVAVGWLAANEDFFLHFWGLRTVELFCSKNLDLRHFCHECREKHSIRVSRIRFWEKLLMRTSRKVCNPDSREPPDISILTSNGCWC